MPSSVARLSKTSSPSASASPVPDQMPRMPPYSKFHMKKGLRNERRRSSERSWRETPLSECDARSLPPRDRVLELLALGPRAREFDGLHGDG